MRRPLPRSIQWMAKLQWMRLADFLDMTDGEDQFLYGDLRATGEAYISEPLTPAQYAQLLQLAEKWRITQALFVTAGTVYANGQFVPASRVVLYGQSLALLGMLGLPLATTSWPHPVAPELMPLPRMGRQRAELM